MSNSRGFRRRLAVSQQARETREMAPRWPWGGPSMSTTRRQLKQLEADGDIERVGVDRTGKPGRPAVLYQMTEQGRSVPDWTDDEKTARDERRERPMSTLAAIDASRPGTVTS